MKSTNLKASPLGEVLKKILRFAQNDSRRAAGVDYRYTKFIFTMNLICCQSIICIASIGCSGSLAVFLCNEKAKYSVIPNEVRDL